ncbi:MAG: hypothetical protein QOD02_3160 [Mycobacterium sp.]|nr:hypothetical protein [Mycobacterium sp.]
MLSRSVEPACRRRHSSVLPGTSGPVSGHDAASPTPPLVLICVYDAPDQQATTTVTRATIHPIANRETTAGRAPLLATTQTRVGTHGAPDSIAVN